MKGEVLLEERQGNAKITRDYERLRELQSGLKCGSKGTEYLATTLCYCLAN